MKLTYKINKLFTRHRKTFIEYLPQVITLIALIVVLIFIFFNQQQKSSDILLKKKITAVDLINSDKWQHVAGVEQAGSQVKIVGLGRAIVNQDGTSNQDNPPINIRGPKLLYESKFTLELEASKLPTHGAASLYFYSEPPTIYDEWRYEPAQLRLDFNKHSIAILTKDGTSDSWKFRKTWGIRIPDPAIIRLNFDPDKPAVYLEIGDVKLEDIFLTNILSAKHLWFGADAPTGESWLMNSFIAKGGGIKLVQQDNPSGMNDQQSLKTLANKRARKISMGTAVANIPLFSDPNYRNILTTQFNMLTPENEMKAQFIHPQPDKYEFTDADSIVDFALANNMAVHGHNLVFSEANPDWMRKAPINQRQQIMIEHIKTLVNHYKNKVSSWDVVDEPLSDYEPDQTLRHNIWFEAMGEEYIDQAFNAARAADPEAKLYLNEYGIEADGPRWDTFLSLISRLKNRGVSIDGVGFQAHIYEPGDEIQTDVLEKHMNDLAKLGLDSRISELDAYGDDLKHQADQYDAVLTACLRVAICTSVTTWGISDKYGSTTEMHRYPINYGNDLLWDKNLLPKPALERLQNSLKTVI